MFEWLQKIFSGAPDPRSAPGTPQPQALVFYGVSQPGALPDAQTPSLVLPDLDPEDPQRCFSPPAAGFERRERSAFIALLDGIDPATFRDPNSRARLGFIRRWLSELQPIEVVWHLEDEQTAGDGVSWGSSPERATPSP